MFCCHRPHSLPQEDIPRVASASITVTNAVESTGGTVQCVIHNGVPPYNIEWKKDGATALISLNADRTIARNVPVGEYEISIQDAVGNHLLEIATVEGTHLPVIDGYLVVNASSDTARDGQVTVNAQNLNTKRFLWTTGVVTNGFTLHDVAPGIYSAHPIGEEGDVIKFVHACEPARVLPSKHI